MKEYDIYVPLTYNDGSAIDPRKFMDLQRKLLEQFDGVTFFPQRNEGLWRFGGVSYRDEIVIYRVFTSKVRAARKFLRQLKEELKRDLEQEEILIIGKDAEAL